MQESSPPARLDDFESLFIDPTKFYYNGSPNTKLCFSHHHPVKHDPLKRFDVLFSFGTWGQKKIKYVKIYTCL